MQKDITYLMGLDVYTDKGIKIGVVDDAVVDTDNGIIKQLALADVVKEFRDPSKRGLLLPFRWVLSIGEIIIVKWPIETEMPGNMETATKEDMDKDKVKESTS
ncbi:MAG TPA: photosystem reaction center subunit H [Halobacteria archaeon]|jgi:sporulation protein YlmC with PRC-barrel domain|nr:photosystem reaction center subunit H [Halobacteria archaeon]